MAISCGTLSLPSCSDDERSGLEPVGEWVIHFLSMEEAITDARLWSTRLSGCVSI